MTINVDRLPPVYVQRDVDPSFVREELDFAIDQAIAGHPRSLQKRIGPSEMGTPCNRRIAYKLAGVEPVNARNAWKPTVGTAVHSWLEEAFERENRDLGSVRYLLEQKVDVGEVGGEAVFGNCDIYDRTTAGVIDWKVVGLSMLRSYKANGPGPQYRTQAHLYGRGWVRKGFAVDWVGIYFLPQNGERHEAVWWTEPYDEQIALDALANVNRVHTLVQLAGSKVALVEKTAEAYCNYCPYFLPASTEVEEACPGHKDEAQPNTATTARQGVPA